MKGFWENLERPIIGLAPMDGVTDAPFRYMVCKHSAPAGPDVVMTEFTNVEGLARGADKMLRAFVFDEIERPVVAQIYGVEVDSYYKAAVMLCEMGFDGIDINMGCPAKKVADRGAGAGLILNPALAKEIVVSVKRGVKDWANGASMKEASVHPRLIKAIEVGWESGERREIPVSVKTRIGYDQDVAEEWVKHLIETEPANISMHGRTLKQMYTGSADWEAIGRAGRVARQAGICFLGNGDVESMGDARSRASQYELDGVLVGRATMGNPWFFAEREASIKDRFNAVREHSELFEKMLPDAPFVIIRKHLAWYCKGFEGARELRMELMKAESSEDVERVLGSFRLT